MGVDAPAEWLALAEEASPQARRRAGSVGAGAQGFPGKAERGEQERRAQGDLVAVERFFPQAAGDRDAGRVDLGRWEQAYASDPGRRLPQRCRPHLRKTLDRRLWADALQRLLEKEAAEDPRSATHSAQRAESELPERPKLATELLDRGLAAAQQGLGSLRLAEVRSIGQAYREKLHNPQDANELYRKWLKIQRDRLSETDAEGPVDLAAQYEELLQDRATARELLVRAWKIDPGSKEVAEAFRTRGYRRVKDEWVEASPGAAPEAAGNPARRRPAGARRGDEPWACGARRRGGHAGNSGSNLTGRSFSGTKGQLIEQWMFHVPGRKDHYVNFLRHPGRTSAPRRLGLLSPSARIAGQTVTSAGTLISSCIIFRGLRFFH